jgi:hypothetical protein
MTPELFNDPFSQHWHKLFGVWATPHLFRMHARAKGISSEMVSAKLP